MKVITKKDLKCTCLSKEAKRVINQAFSHGISQEILHKKIWEGNLKEARRQENWDQVDLVERVIQTIDQQLHNLNDTFTILKGLPEC